METTRRYDLWRLRVDLRHAAETISATKKILRRSGYNPTSQEYEDLKMWKEVATNLCCLRAHHRGKMHCKDPVKNEEILQLIEHHYLRKEAA